MGNTSFRTSPDGTITSMFTSEPDTRPTLREAQAFVGGHVRMAVNKKRMQVLVLDDDPGQGLDVNREASRIAGMRLAGNAIVLKGKAMWVDSLWPVANPEEEDE